MRFAKPIRLTKPAKTPCLKPLSLFWRVVTLKTQYAVRFPSAATAIRWRQLRAGLPKRFTVYRSTSRKKHFPICPRICGKLPRIFTARLQNKKHRGRFWRSLGVFRYIQILFRQSHGKGTAFAFGAFDRDGTACQLAGGLHQRQPESVADGAV